MRKLKGLFLDFNGVVIDDEPPWFKAWREVHSRHGVSLSERQWAAIPDTNAQPDYWLGVPATRAEWKFATDTAVAEIEQLEVLPGVTELLQEARDCNMVTALITNSHESWVRRWLPKSLESHFIAHRTRGGGDPAKPDGTMHIGALRYFGLAPHEVVGVEDTRRGIAALHAAGVHPLYVPAAITRHEEIDGVVRLDSLHGVTIDSLAMTFDGRPPMAMAL